ncbi:hypothetical protein IP91_00142 [Pseudoduganella lurida]|uniref:DUF4175 domain-containing protein n=1 Tax=Pseudoduganella lurida TaxID=1036180 RepID=A0A562RJ28_9BURK|nr:hypothetical protein [Pseudoduganella lurida]TWI69077.1 hypothetical protein IP91_00142 [Pseudoduganella lurida]
MKPSFMRLWGVPILLGVLTAIGLLSALLGDGVWDLVSALALAVPVLLGTWHSLRKQGR